MEHFATAIQLAAIKPFLIWGTIYTIAAFHMQRLHYEMARDVVSGKAEVPSPSELRGAELMSKFANLSYWVALLSPLYVWYRLGWAPALAIFAIVWALGQIENIVEARWVRMPTKLLAQICTPVGIGSFMMLVWSLVQL